MSQGLEGMTLKMQKVETVCDVLGLFSGDSKAKYAIKC